MGALASASVLPMNIYRIYKTTLKKNKLEGLQYLTPRIITSTSNQSCVALAEDTQLNQ